MPGSENYRTLKNETSSRGTALPESVYDYIANLRLVMMHRHTPDDTPGLRADSDRDPDPSR